MLKQSLTDFTGILYGKGTVYDDDRLFARNIDYRLSVPPPSATEDALMDGNDGQPRNRVFLKLSPKSRLIGYRVCGTSELTLVMRNGIRQDFRLIAENETIEPIAGPYRIERMIR